ncbi:hypothetical protein AB9P05_23765 [Roseivirga sp. BDSF3-8]|uniref:hypothetical protein n=1 Tax=Roseivirga sp. BDSF3-8 TaxID=3241598 RepID=UPI003531B951
MPAITPFHHCAICENRHMDGLTGAYCSLTGNKPAFSLTCDDISITTELETNLKALNEARYLALAEKVPAIFHLFIYLLFSLLAFGAGYILMQAAWAVGWIFTLPFLIMVIGLVLLRQAVTPVFTFKKVLKEADDKLYIMNTVLRTYNIRYEPVNVKVNKDMHGNKDVTMDIRYFKA